MLFKYFEFNYIYILNRFVAFTKCLFGVTVALML